MQGAWRGAASRALRLLRVPLCAAFVLFGSYVVLALFMSPHGYLGTDTGAKVATLEVMTERGTARPVLGYWAEAQDPEGRLHPIYDAHSADGDWVHVTTLPMLELARPLYELGGYRFTLVLPMLGAVGAAFAARSLAGRAADEDAGWAAYWIVGLASPITIYALDFWEHAPGVACMAGAVALLAGVVDGQPRHLRSIGAGSLLGLAATMRTESFVYALVSVGLCCVVLVVRDRSIKAALAVGILSVLGFLGPWLANGSLERAVGGTDRGARASATVSAGVDAGVDNLSERGREAVVTLLALRPQSFDRVLLLGGAIAIALLLALVYARRQERNLAASLLVMVALVHALTAISGLGFMPGMLAATPIAAAAFVLPSRQPGPRFALAAAVLTLPVVWAFQFVGGAGPQWGGRYTLTSAVLFAALGTAGLMRVDTGVRRALFGLAALITLSGLLWLSERSHGFERLFDELVERPEDVVVARNGFLIREGGAAYVERRWLTAVSDDDLELAAEAIAEADLSTFAVVDGQEVPDPRVGAALLAGTDHMSFVGVDFYVHSYRIE